MAAESTAIVCDRCNLFIYYFVSINERPATGSQPNLASKSEVVSFYNCPTKTSEAVPKNLRRIKHQILDHVFGDFRTRHRISPKRNMDKQKCYSVNLQCIP